MASLSPFHLIPVLAAAAVFAGCGQSIRTSNRPASDPPPMAPTGKLSNVLAREEIGRVAANTAFDAVSRLRPQFLRRHGIGRAAQPAGQLALVYLDGVPLGGIETLQSLSADHIVEIRFMDPIEAAIRLGVTTGGGVIEVRTRG